MTPPSSSGSDDAFARRLYNPAFRKQAKKTSRPFFPELLRSESEEIIDLALQRAYNKRHQFRDRKKEDLLKWVLEIIKNLTRDILKKRVGQPEEHQFPSEEEYEDPRARHPRQSLRLPEQKAAGEETALPEEARAWLETTSGLLDMLRPDDREVLLLRVGQGFSTRETAQLLSAGGIEVTEDAVKMRLLRAQKRIIEIAQKIDPNARKPYPPIG